MTRICVECKWYEARLAPGAQGITGRTEGTVWHTCMRPQERTNPVTGETFRNKSGSDAMSERGTYNPPNGCGMEALYWEPAG